MHDTGLFLSTLSLRRATRALRKLTGSKSVFLSTLSLRRATSLISQTRMHPWISIHALLAESDRRTQTASDLVNISIHALLAESDRTLRTHKLSTVDFYPRSPCGERLYTAMPAPPIPNFYPRSPCGERLVVIALRHVHGIISIHALLAESDRPVSALYSVNRYFYPRSPCGERLAKTKTLRKVKNFYPRSPCGERPHKFIGAGHCNVISIHALLAESDCF